MYKGNLILFSDILFNYWLLTIDNFFQSKKKNKQTINHDIYLIDVKESIVTSYSSIKNILMLFSKKTKLKNYTRRKATDLQLCVTLLKDTWAVAVGLHCHEWIVKFAVV